MSYQKYVDLFAHMMNQRPFDSVHAYAEPLGEGFAYYLLLKRKGIPVHELFLGDGDDPAFFYSEQGINILTLVRDVLNANFPEVDCSTINAFIAKSKKESE